MKKITLALASAATLAVSAGAVYAQAPTQADRAKADRGADMTRAQFEQRTAATFARLDANKDGTFDAADRALLDAQRAEHQAERQAARFVQLDTDKNGSLSRAEFEAGFDPARDRRADGKRGGKGGGWGGGGGGPGRALGAEGDKAMTQAEFTAAALARFDRADTNRDGTVTADERKAQRAERRTDRRGPKPDAKS